MGPSGQRIPMPTGTRVAERAPCVHQATRSRHQGGSGHLPCQPERLHWMSDEAAVLPQYAGAQDPTQRARRLTQRGARACRYAAVPAVQARSKEGGDAVRSPQTHPQARPPALARTERGTRRVLVGGNRTEPATNGQEVVRKAANRSRSADLKRVRALATPPTVKDHAFAQHPEPRAHPSARSRTGFFNGIGLARIFIEIDEIARQSVDATAS